MKKYLVKSRKRNEVCGKFSSKNEATTEMICYINEHNFNKDESCEDFLTPFDFYLEKIEVTEVNEIITDFETARERLGGKPNMDFTVAQKVVSRNAVRLEDVTRLVQSLNPSHIKALVALNELFTIADAWNKEDGFVPDFSNRNQWKYFPWFTYNNDAAGFVFAFSLGSAAGADASFGSRLCFKSESRAEQFGKQFAHLYNKVFLLNQ